MNKRQTIKTNVTRRHVPRFIIIIKNTHTVKSITQSLTHNYTP